MYLSMLNTVCLPTLWILLNRPGVCCVHCINLTSTVCFETTVRPFVRTHCQSIILLKSKISLGRALFHATRLVETYLAQSCMAQLSINDHPRRGEHSRWQDHRRWHQATTKDVSCHAGTVPQPANTKLASRPT